jgi:hypothetical protein
MNENAMLNRFVDALREIGAALERAVERGERAAQIDAHDLVETLLSIADRLDPPVRGSGNPSPSLVDAARALLEARESQMVTAVEWDRLRQAVDAAECDR